MEAGFEIIDHTADIGLYVWSKSCEELLEKAALGTISIIVDIHSIQCRNKRIVRVEAEQIEELLFNWLRELLFLVEQEGMVFSKFQIKRDNFAHERDHKYVFYCSLGGEKIDSKRHNICREIKAVTRHGFYVRQETHFWEARIYFDV
ncbi:archease [bacterium]|nr:archease [bacterium]RQV93293.1 MAG: archease [bacterium]